VGIFLTCGVCLLIAVFAVISIKRRQPTETFHIKFEQSVSGLTNDSNVLYLGVPVGKVQDIRVTKHNDIIVTIDVEKNRITLRKGTIATLAIGNLMGGMQIELSGGDPKAPPLQRGSLIPSKPSMMENIAQDLPQILNDIRKILAKLDKAIGEVKGDRLGELVRNADEMVKTADTTLKGVNLFLKSTRGAIIDTEYEVSQTMRILREAIVQVERTFTSLNDNPSSVLWGRPKPKNPYVK
jgi:phospholipid/cholesterol/gamma-HCH transport system substrate-binding protein